MITSRQTAKPGCRPNSKLPFAHRTLVWILALTVFSGAARARDLTTLSLEELMEIEVTTLGRRERPLARMPAAVTIISHEEILRSGMTTIPELLRLVPGLHVAQTDGHTWSVSCRGFNGEFAAKMLVMIDGRGIDTPLMADMVWELNDLMIEDLERIEVMRGPSATMWGAGALNGVVNIVTRSARDTQGGLVTATAGNVEHFGGAARYGGAVGTKGHYRVFGKFDGRGSELLPGGLPAADNSDSGRMGVRIDLDPTEKDSLLIVGGAGASRLGRNLALPSLVPPYAVFYSERYSLEAFDTTLEWRRRHQRGAETTLRFSFDHYGRDDMMLNDHMDRVQLELEHYQRPLGRHSLSWGGGYQLSAIATEATGHFSATPATEQLTRLRAFVEDEVRLSGETTSLTLGMMGEHNPFSGLEIQPTARLLWEPRPNASLWLAASRAAREPAWGEARVEYLSTVMEPSPLSMGLPVAGVYTGILDFEPRTMVALEAGYRTRLARHLTLDLAGYYNRLDNLRYLVEAGAPTLELAPVPHLRLPAATKTGMAAATWGLEAAAQWTATEFWELRGSYSWLGSRCDDVTTQGMVSWGEIRPMPAHQANLRSWLNLPLAMKLDTTVFFVDTVPALSTEPLYYDAIPRWVRLDVKYSWQPTRDLELSVVGQNLTDDRHAELNAKIIFVPGEVRRSVFGKVTWRF